VKNSLCGGLWGGVNVIVFEGVKVKKVLKS